MVWERTRAGRLFTEIQRVVLGAILFGIEGMDGECKDSPRDSLAQILFPGMAQGTAFSRVNSVLKGAVKRRLRNILPSDTNSCAEFGQEDWGFLWKIKTRYPRGYRQVEAALEAFLEGRGLPAYKRIDVPEMLAQQERPVAGPRKTSGGEYNRFPGFAPQITDPDGVRPWFAPAKEQTIFDRILVIPPYGRECSSEDHKWKKDLTRGGELIILRCQVCGAQGEIIGPDTQAIWSALQEVMRAKNQAA